MDDSSLFLLNCMKITNKLFKPYSTLGICLNGVVKICMNIIIFIFANIQLNYHSRKKIKKEKYSLGPLSIQPKIIQ